MWSEEGYWKFGGDYGPEYIAFSNEGLDGGFFKSNLLIINRWS